ncbi:hypothetical protein [Streptomyces sp. NPDC096311]|uniref:hypothetical protein n=1 Tax=Streptomyces sp. NPDC096311 TaxID=3366083 RepID=UPI0038221191
MRHAEREERTFGEHLGQGMRVQEATTATGQTAEGVNSCRAIWTCRGSTGLRCRSPRSSPR